MEQLRLSVGGRTLVLESGRIARQAHGAVLLREGGTVVLATVVHRTEAQKRRGFLPLTVDYREFLSAAGRIPGSFARREGRSSEGEIIAARLCDRSLRPLFPHSFRNETQVITSVLSAEASGDPSVLAILAASAALHISEIPWSGPVAALRVGRVAGRLVSMPSPEQMRESDLDFVLTVSKEGIVMLEGGARVVEEAQILEAFAFATQEAQPLLEGLDVLRHKIGREKRPLAELPAETTWSPGLREAALAPLQSALCEADKMRRQAAVRQAKQDALETLGEQAAEEAEVAADLLDQLEGELLRARIMEEGLRPDGRGAQDIRPISCEVNWLPGPHGSALFCRGETQAIVTLTLGSKEDRQRVETLAGLSTERFLLHYGFPPYSVGEVRPQRGPGRREIGHAALARRALLPVLPAETEFPYTLRILSEISESNGSSSMATVCGGTLALMDGGVPIAAPVAGIAMGLVTQGDKRVILSDILGDEDHLGDMDFKVAGSAEGITALQMDNKAGSLPAVVLEEAFEQARRGRLHILEQMLETLPAQPGKPKPHAPRHVQLRIAPHRIRELIGPGGRVIQGIQKRTGSHVEVGEEGIVRIYASGDEALQKAHEAVLQVAGEIQLNEIYAGKVVSVHDFGAFVRVRGVEGLVPASQWESPRGAPMLAATREGEAVHVKTLPPDRRGRLVFSRREALALPAAEPAQEPQLTAEVSAEPAQTS